jgi:hypothetical protein
MNNYHAQMPPLLPSDMQHRMERSNYHETRPTLDAVPNIELTDNDFKSSDIMGPASRSMPADQNIRSRNNIKGPNVNPPAPLESQNIRQNQNNAPVAQPQYSHTASSIPMVPSAPPMEPNHAYAHTGSQPKNSNTQPTPAPASGVPKAHHPQIDPDAKQINDNISKLKGGKTKEKLPKEKTASTKNAKSTPTKDLGKKKVNPAVYQYVVIPIFLFIVFIVLVYPKTSNLFSKWLGPIETSKGLLYRAALLSFLYVIFTTSLKAFAK